MKISDRTFTVIIIIAIFVLLMYLVSGKKSPHDVLYNKFVKAMNALKPYTSMQITTDKLDDTIKADMFTQHVVVEGFEAVPTSDARPITDLGRAYERQNVVILRIAELESGIPSLIQDLSGCPTGDFREENWPYTLNDKGSKKYTETEFTPCMTWQYYHERFHDRLSWAVNRYNNHVRGEYAGDDAQKNKEIARADVLIGHANDAIGKLYELEPIFTSDAEELKDLRTEYFNLANEVYQLELNALTLHEEIKIYDAGIVDGYVNAKRAVFDEMHKLSKEQLLLTETHFERRKATINGSSDLSLYDNSIITTNANISDIKNNLMKKENELYEIEESMGTIIAYTDLTTERTNIENSIVADLTTLMRKTSDYLLMLEVNSSSQYVLGLSDDIGNLFKNISSNYNSLHLKRVDELNAQSLILKGEETNSSNIDKVSANEKTIQKWNRETQAAYVELKNAVAKMDMLSHPIETPINMVYDPERESKYAEFIVRENNERDQLYALRNNYFKSLVERNITYDAAIDNARNTGDIATAAAKIPTIKTVEEAEAIKAELQAIIDNNMATIKINDLIKTIEDNVIYIRNDKVKDTIGVSDTSLLDAYYYAETTLAEINAINKKERDEVEQVHKKAFEDIIPKYKDELKKRNIAFFNVEKMTLTDVHNRISELEDLIKTDENEITVLENELSLIEDELTRMGEQEVGKKKVGRKENDRDKIINDINKLKTELNDKNIEHQHMVKIVNGGKSGISGINRDLLVEEEMLVMAKELKDKKYDVVEDGTYNDLKAIAILSYDLDFGVKKAEFRQQYEAYLILDERATELANIAEKTKSAKDTTNAEAAETEAVDYYNNYINNINQYMNEIDTLYDNIYTGHKIHIVETESQAYIEDVLFKQIDDIIKQIRAGSYVPPNDIDGANTNVVLDNIRYYDVLDMKVQELQKELGRLAEAGGSTDDQTRIQSQIDIIKGQQITHISTTKSIINEKVIYFTEKSMGATEGSAEKARYDALVIYYTDLVDAIDYMGVEANVAKWLFETYKRPILIDLGMAIFNTPMFDDLGIEEENIIVDSNGINTINEAVVIDRIKEYISPLINSFMVDSIDVFLNNLNTSIINETNMTINNKTLPIRQPTETVTEEPASGEVIQYGTVDLGTVDLSGM